MHLRLQHCHAAKMRALHAGFRLSELHVSHEAQIILLSVKVDHIISSLSGVVLCSLQRAF